MYPSNQGLSDGKNKSNSSAAPSAGVPISDHPLHHHHQQEGEWSIGLCGFCSNCKTCCLTWWCPCITFGRIAEIVDQGTTSCAATGAIYCLLAYFTGCGCLYSCLYRSKLRHQFKLRESPCNDCLVHCCCEYCALCQEYNELKHRGFDMSLGWHGNMQKRNGGVAMAAPTAPVVQEVMTR